MTWAAVRRHNQLESLDWEFADLMSLTVLSLWGVTLEKFTGSIHREDLGTEEELRWSDLERFAVSGVPIALPDWIGEQLLGENVNELEWFSTVEFNPRVHPRNLHARVRSALFNNTAPATDGLSITTPSAKSGTTRQTTTHDK